MYIDHYRSISVHTRSPSKFPVHDQVSQDYFDHEQDKFPSQIKIRGHLLSQRVDATLAPGRTSQQEKPGITWSAEQNTKGGSTQEKQKGTDLYCVISLESISIFEAETLPLSSKGKLILDMGAVHVLLDPARS